MKIKGSTIPKTILPKKNKVGEFILPDFKTSLQCYRDICRRESPEKTSYIYDQITDEEDAKMT